MSKVSFIFNNREDVASVLSKTPKWESRYISCNDTIKQDVLLNDSAYLCATFNNQFSDGIRTQLLNAINILNQRTKEEKEIPPLQFLKSKASVTLTDSLPDSAVGVFPLQLAEYERTIYSTLYQSAQALEFFDVLGVENPYANRLISTCLDWTGDSEFASDGGLANDSIPTIGAKQTQYATTILESRNKFIITTEEMRALSNSKDYWNTNIVSLYQDYAQEAHINKLERCVWTGEDLSGFNGILTDPNVPSESAAPSGTGGSTKFDDKSGEEMLADLNSLVNTIINNTNGIAAKDRIFVVLPVEQYTKISTTPINPTNASYNTVKDVFLTNQNKVTCYSSNFLKGASRTLSGEDVMIAYVKRPDAVALVLPVPFALEQPAFFGDHWEYITYMRTGGIIIRRPKMLNIIEGI